MDSVIIIVQLQLLTFGVWLLLEFYTVGRTKQAILIHNVLETSRFFNFLKIFLLD